MNGISMKMTESGRVESFTCFLTLGFYYFHFQKESLLWSFVE